MRTRNGRPSACASARSARATAHEASCVCQCQWQGKPGRAKVYSGVRGKILDRIAHQFEEGRFYLHVCLKDKTEVNLTLSSRRVIEEAVLTDMSSGNSKPIKEYVSYEG